MGALVVMTTTLQWYIFIAIYIIEATYFGVVQIIGKWDNVVERLLFGVTEGVIITVFSFFNFGKADMLHTTDAEFYIITIAFGLELFYEAYKYIRWLQTCGSQKVASESPSMIPM